MWDRQLESLLSARGTGRGWILAVREHMPTPGDRYSFTMAECVEPGGVL